MSNYTKYAVRGTVLVFVISILSAFLGYLVRFLLARNLTLEEFGLFYAVFAFLGFLGIFKSLGFDKSLIKFIPELKHNKKRDFIKSSIIYVSIIQLITNSIIIFLIYLFSNYLSVHFFHSTQATAVLKLLAIAFFIDSFVFILKFAFQGFQKMLLFSGIDLLRMVLILVIAFIGFKLNYKLLSPIIAYTITPVILILVFIPVLTKKVFPRFFKSKFFFNSSLLKRMSSYSIFIMVTSVGGIILGYTDSMMLTYFSGLENVGLYNIALPTARVLTFFPMAIMGVMLPLTSELWSKKKKLLLKVGLESLYKYAIIVIMPLALTMFSFAGLLISVLFGSEYVSADNTLRILSIGMIFATLYTINFSFFSGIGKPKINSKIVYTAAIFNFIANLILIPLIGIIGAAITTTIGYFIMAFAGLFRIRKYIKIELPIKIWGKTALSGIIFISIIFILKKIITLNIWIETAILLAVSGIVYTALLFLLNIINIKELKDIYRRIVK